MSDIFPLPLAPLEDFVLLDDKPFYRKTIILDLDFTGEINRSAFEAGLREALSCHPLLTARVKRRCWGLSRWVQPGSVYPQVIWLSDDQAFELAEDEGIDVTVESGVRFHVRVGVGVSRMIVLIHHACCDGAGAIQFMSDVFTGYANHARRADDQREFHELQPERLLERSRFSLRVPDGMPVTQTERFLDGEQELTESLSEFGMFDPFDDAFGLVATDDGAEGGEAGLELGQEHVLVRLLRFCADGGQAVAGQREMG